MYQHLLNFLNLLILHSIIQLSLFLLKIFVLKNIHSYCVTKLLLIQLFKELLWPFHLTYSLLPFCLCYFFNSKLFLIRFFAILFHKNVPPISSPLRPLITDVHGTVFLTFLVTKTSSDQFGT